MLTIILCDDNEFLLSRYQSQLLKITKKHQEDVRFIKFTSGESLLFHLEENPNEADIIFLDIMMGNLNGIETAKKLRSLGCISEIIFLTSSEAFVFDSFDVSPLHYIVKGSSFEYEKIEDILLKAITLVKEKESSVFFVETSGQKRKIPLHKISYFEIMGRIVTVHFGMEKFKFYSSMDLLEDQLLEKKFVRCHKSFLINIKYVDTIEKNEIILTTGTILPLGSSYAKAVKQSFSQNLSTLF